MKNKPVALLAICYSVITLFTLLAIIITGRTYSVYINDPYDEKVTEVVYSQEGIVENTDIQYKDGYVIARFKSVKKGRTVGQFTVYNKENLKESTTAYLDFTVLPTGVIYISGYDYGGYKFTILGMALVTLCTFLVCYKRFKAHKKKQFFSYKTVLSLAFITFFGFQTLMYFGLFAGSVFYPHIFDSWQVYNLAGLIMMYMVALSLPFMVLLACFLSLSNLSLIRHEGLGKNNLFGFFISAVLFFGSLLCVILTLRNPNSTGLQLSEIRNAVLRTAISTGFVYFECVLFSTLYCTQYAARHEPKYNQDFIMILGCKIKKDGTPTPLLKGRIDRALKFYNDQLESTGKQAYFIPSGGKGEDEVISEAECMKNYLIEQGIEESLILPETKSSNTLENMRFSYAIANEKKKNSNILFSTTNYHIFRSGILSAKAGMRADGIGAKTKWYFWPNAQMREFIGLIASEWKINTMFIFVTVALSVLFANISTIINILA